MPDHLWPTDPTAHVWGPWYANTNQRGTTPATQYRMCVHPDCIRVEYRDAPRA